MKGSPPSLDSEILLGRLVVDQGLARPEQVEECLSQMAELATQGVPYPRLGDLMISKGYLTVPQVKLLNRMMQALQSVQPPALSQSQKISMPPAALEAVKDPDNQVGKYIRVERIGAGGMGEVWKAWDPELRRWVALKFLRYRDATEVSRFKREAQTSAKLHHPNICAVYEVGEHQGHLYIAMQFAEGQTLSTFPRNDRRLLVELVRDAALAAHYAHEQGFVHRDIKPSNLMVEGDPRERKKSSHPTIAHKISYGFKVYIMDFGLVKPLSGPSSVSQTGMAIGTPVYMSPEQACGNVNSVTARSDVYSLGATLYELLTDRPPFRHGEIYELLVKVIEEEPPRVRKINPRVDIDLERVVTKAMHKDPLQRYSTALELAEDLTRWLEGEAVMAAPRSTRRILWKKVGERKAWVTAGAGVLILLTALLWMVMAQAAQDQREVKAGRSRVVTQLARTAEASLKGAFNARKTGDLAEMRGFEETIKEACHEVSREYPDLPEPHYYLGRMFRVLMKDDEARAEQDLALSREPSLIPALYERMALLTSGYVRRTEEIWWEKALHGVRTAEDVAKPGAGMPAFDRNDLSRDLLAGDFRSRLQMDAERMKLMGDRAGAREAGFATAILAWLKGDREAARQGAREAFKEAPSAAEFHEFMAALDLEEGRFEKALLRLGEGMDRDKGYLPFLESRARVRLQWSLQRAAEGMDPSDLLRLAVEEDLTRALGISSSRPVPLQLRGNAYWLRARWKLAKKQPSAADFRLALDDYKDAIRLSPSLEPELHAQIEDCQRSRP